MTIEEIAIRREIRQILNEAGINKESLKEMAKELLQGELEKSVKRALSETNVRAMVYKTVNSYETRDTIKYAIKDALRDWVNTIDIKMEIKDRLDNQSISKELNNTINWN